MYDQSTQSFMDEMNRRNAVELKAAAAKRDNPLRLRGKYDGSDLGAMFLFGLAWIISIVAILNGWSLWIPVTAHFVMLIVGIWASHVGWTFICFILSAASVIYVIWQINPEVIRPVLSQLGIFI